MTKKKSHLFLVFYIRNCKNTSLNKNLPEDTWQRSKVVIGWILIAGSSLAREGSAN